MLDRPEEMAALMACAYVKFTGRLGVYLATSGQGRIHLLNGLCDAKRDGAHVLALTGQIHHDLIGTRYPQEVNLLSLFEDVAVYNQQVMGAGHAEGVIDVACRTSRSMHGVAHVSCPVFSRAGAHERRRVENEGPWRDCIDVAESDPVSPRGCSWRHRS